MPVQRRRRHIEPPSHIIDSDCRISEQRLRRFQIVGQPVSFACDPDTGELRRHTDYGFKINQPTSFTPPGELVVNTVSECRFAYNDSTVLQRNGLISLWLKLTREGESVSLQQQINVDNTP